MTTSTTDDGAAVVTQTETPVTHEWTVLKRRDLSETSPTQNAIWDEAGSILSEYEYSLHLDRDTLGKFRWLGGPGEYLLICGKVCERVVIAADTVYRRVDEGGE